MAAGPQAAWGIPSYADVHASTSLRGSAATALTATSAAWDRDLLRVGTTNRMMDLNIYIYMAIYIHVHVANRPLSLKDIIGRWQLLDFEDFQSVAKRRILRTWDRNHHPQKGTLWL